MPLSAGTRLGPYEILSALGAGGMGEVYRARDTRLERDVAIKVLAERFATDPDRLHRFEHEARAIAALNHPHICQLHDIGPGYLVLEYIGGVPLHGPMAVEHALRLALQMVSALEAANQRGILHRDLKPANIMVTREGTAKLLDFGLAKLMNVDADVTRTLDGTVVGTAAYMSPERAQGQSLDARSDVFSFGVDVSFRRRSAGHRHNSHTWSNLGRDLCYAWRSILVMPLQATVVVVSMIAGSDFVELGDTTSPQQAVVNEEFVRRYSQDAEPLGRRIDVTGRRYVITAVVRNSVSEAFGEPGIPCIYFSYRDRPAPVGQFHLRTRNGDERRLAPGLRHAVGAIDVSLPVYDIRTLTEHVETNLGLRKIPARTFVVLGPMLLVLAAIGIYAVVAYTVAHRTAEIGVRLALGARARTVIVQIVSDNMKVVLVAAVASCLPAQRASRIDHVAALRGE